MPEKRVYYGGQAVIEGVMIRGPRNVAVACRRPDGVITVRREALGNLYTGALRRIPLLRGIIVLWETLALGMRALMFSSNVALGEEDKELKSGGMWVGVFAAVGMIAMLFFAGPVLLSGLLESLIEIEFFVVLIEGLIRLGMIIAYIGLIGLMPDIRRVYAYHGAEHKSIHALEHGDPLETQHVQRYPTAHVRCGTSFLLTVVIVSVFVFAAVGSPDLWLRVLSRVVLLPVVASIAYEFIRLGGAFEHNPITHILMWPNLALQKLTTRQPDDSQVEVALRALHEVLQAEGVAAAPVPVTQDDAEPTALA